MNTNLQRVSLPLLKATGGRNYSRTGEKREGTVADKKVAVIVGAGTGLSASLARRFAREGFAVALAARTTEKLAPLVKETGAKAYSCDASDKDQVATLFASIDNDLGEPEVAVYNASR